MKKISFIVLVIILIAPIALFSKNLTQVNRILPSNFELLDVEIESTYMIIPAGLGGAVLYDITNPIEPSSLAILRVGEFLFTRTYNWDMTSKLAIGTGRKKGMAIYNIRQKNQPQKLVVYDPNLDTTIGATGTISFEDVEIYKNHALVAAHAHGLMIYDLSEPSDPIFVSSIATENAVSLAVNNDVVYLADGDGGLKIINIEDLANPELISSHPTTGSTRDIKFSNGFVFLASGGKGVDVFDVRSAKAVWVDNKPTAGFASRVAVSGNKVSASVWTRVEVFEWDGTSLQLVGYKNTGGRVMAVGAASPDIIYSAEWEVLRIFQFGPVSDADIDLSSRDLDFRQLANNESDTLDLILENNGNTTLDILAYGTTSADFIVQPQVTEIQPSQREKVNVIYTAGSNSGGGALEILSNDPDESSVRVTLRGNSTRNAEIGKEAPNFNLNAVANASGNVSLDQFRGKVVVLALFASW